MTTILHHPEQCRFETVVDGYTAYVEYEITNQALDILHTIVPKEIGGRGIAAELVATAYEYADGVGLATKATCSYAAVWLRRHG